MYGEWVEEPAKGLFNGMPISRDVDPPNYDSKYKFWSERILQQQEIKKEATFTLSEVQNYTSYKGLQPLCLEEVIVSYAKRKTNEGNNNKKFRN